MKSTSVKVSLDTRRAKADGTYPLILRLTHDRKTTSIKTGFHLKKEEWDQEKGVVKKSYSGAIHLTRLNNEIQKKKAEALDEILKLQGKEKKSSLTVTDVKSKIAPNITTESFYAFSELLIEQLFVAERIGTAQSYKMAVQFLKTFNKGMPFKKCKGGNPKTSKFKVGHFSDLKFDEITYSFLTKLEAYHLGAGNEINGLAVYLRTIRSIYNQAIKAGKVDISLYPFSQYKIKTNPTRKRALDISSLIKIIKLDLPQNHSCFNARNYFVASYMMYGMSFSDMAHLQKTDIVNGRINYRRRKTSKLYDIKVSEKLASILNYYIQQNPTSKFVFPIIKRESALLHQRDKQSSHKIFNKNLKIIAEICDIEENLTSYVSRHSFATNAMMQDVPINAISAMLGHSSLKTTEIYLKSLPTNILDDYNKLILDLK